MCYSSHHALKLTSPVVHLDLSHGPDQVPFIGPVISSCGLEQGGASLRVEFNRSLLGDDKIMVKPYNRTEKASATFVRLDEPLPENAWQNHVYKNRAPWWGDDSTWFQVDIELAPSVCTVLHCVSLRF